MKASRGFQGPESVYTEGFRFYLEGFNYMKQSISQWLKKSWQHVLCWSIFVLYETVFMSLVYDYKLNVANALLHYVAFIALFYSAANLAIPWSVKFKMHAFWRVPFVLAILIASYILLNFITDIFVIRSGIVVRKEMISLDLTYCLRVLYRGVFVLGFAVAYFSAKHFLREKQKTSEMEKQHLKSQIREERMQRNLAKAQNDYLKAQINPHFLFNTLDYVYHNISIQNPDAADALITLSEMMRYAIASDGAGEFIVLGEELEQVEKLIYLYQLRKNNALNIVIDFSDEVRNLPFIPLVVLTLVENIFKHGNVADKIVPTLVRVIQDKGLLKIETRNAININPQDSGTHSGLSNIQNRLRFAYGDAVSFDFGLKAADYSVLITLPIPTLLSAQESRVLFEYNPN
jgi:two-component system LytT family sensor kinase